MMNKLPLYGSRILQAVLVVLVLTNAFKISAQDKEQNTKLTSEAKQARDHSIRILDEMKDILKEHYYDPKFHGVDLDTRIEAAKARVKTLQYNWQMYRVLVQVLMDFNDSHTVMILPPRSDYFQYGFALQMIGNDCFVTSVKKDSDAQAQGLEVGDQVISIGKFKPNRRDLWKINYVIYKLDPADTLDLQIRKPDGADKTLTVKAKKMTDKEFRAERKARKDKDKFEPFKCQEVNKDLIACKLYSFTVEKNDIDKMMKQVSAYPKFILDLRGNGGGLVSIEEYLVSHFFDREVKIAEVITRAKSQVRTSKLLGDRQYKGEVAVLIDSDSGSAAEITARVLQLEQRAKVLGDVSAGAVMTSIALPFRNIMSMLADAAIIRVGMAVSVADVIMRDGSRLENIGVIPDETIQPTASALKLKTDPVLAYAAHKMGSQLTPEKAGSFYFLVSKAESGDDEETDK